MENKKLGITKILECYFKNFHKLLFANLLFGVPAAIFIGLISLINKLTGVNNIFITLLLIVFLYPFFAGVTVITRNIVKGCNEFTIVTSFAKAIKENFIYFLIHGIVLYLITVLCYSSLLLYWNMAQSSVVFYGFFAVASIIAILLLFAFYNIPVMTVTFDLSLKDIYKNCLLISFGEIKNNFFATLGLAILFMICFTVTLCSTSVVALIIILSTLVLLFLPSTASFIMNYFIYKDMENIMLSKSGKNTESEEEAIIQENNEKAAKEILDFSNVDLDENKDGEEYLYFNGKMIKRRVLIALKNKQESENE